MQHAVLVSPKFQLDLFSIRQYDPQAVVPFPSHLGDVLVADSFRPGQEAAVNSLSRVQKAFLAITEKGDIFYRDDLFALNARCICFYSVEETSRTRLFRKYRFCRCFRGVNCRPNTFGQAVQPEFPVFCKVLFNYFAFLICGPCLI